MSWLAAATKRVFETLASSASALARSSSALSRVSSLVRSRTRRSNVALARSSASAAFTLGVMSVNVVTRPPSGMRLARTSMTRPRSAKRSRNGSASAVYLAMRSAIAASSVLAVVVAVLGDVAQDFAERDADAGQIVRQVENLAELPVPANQAEVLVEHGDALPHVIERRLQHLAVVMDRRVGIVEQLERVLGRHRALAQEQRQHQPRRRRADRRGEQIFAVLQHFEVGLGLPARD